MKLAVTHKVTLLPTLIIFKNGQEVDRILQGASKQNIIARLKALI
jgi:thiol-disulfide isomerase/thioredoxin